MTSYTLCHITCKTRCLWPLCCSPACCSICSNHPNITTMQFCLSLEKVLWMSLHSSSGIVVHVTISCYEPIWMLRSLGDALLWILATREVDLTGTMQRDFPIVAPGLQNALPSGLRSVSTPAAFGKWVETHISKLVCV